MSTATTQEIPTPEPRERPEDRPPIPPDDGKPDVLAQLERDEKVIRQHLNGLPAGRKMRSIKLDETYKAKGYASFAT
jgi:hypothetical protein